MIRGASEKLVILHELQVFIAVGTVESVETRIFISVHYSESFEKKDRSEYTVLFLSFREFGVYGLC